MTNINKKSTMMRPLKRGWQKELAKECDVNYNTVRNAIFNEAESEESDRVRARFAEKYPEYVTV